MTKTKRKSGGVRCDVGGSVQTRRLFKGTGAASGCSHIQTKGRCFVSRFMNERGGVDVDRAAEAFQMSKVQLAQTIGLGIASVTKADRRVAPKVKSRMTEMIEIIARVLDYTGGGPQAMAWYRSQPIPALNGRTPQALVKAGQATAVREYLDHFALGGFA
jgi:uncharacterized protein (DUF2384 family)